MEKETKKTPRAQQTRSESERPKVWVNSSALDAPKCPAGYRQRWIRYETMGHDDTKNIMAKLRQGWELVRADLYPQENYPQLGDGRYKGYIGVGGLVLARIPEEIAKQRDAHFKKLASDKNEAVENEPLKDQHPSMPVTSQRRTSYSFGGAKKND
tara:strand:- start:700 stop:1164 length:465 start_codon:yes stop_codon:yes gene_type:complete